MLDGEVWGFEKRIEAVGDCASLSFDAPAGRIQAWREDGRWAAVVPLREGVNRITAHCDGKRSAERVFTVPLSDRPQAWLRSTVVDGRLVLDAGPSRPAPGRAAPIVAWEWSTGQSGSRIEIDPPGADGEHAVSLRVTDALGRSDRTTVPYRVRDGRPEAIDLARAHPAWADDAVVYGVVPHLFGPRGLADVTARLDHIRALGATVLWLAPITDAPDDDFGYAVRDHFRLRDSIGSDEDLQALVEAAHARGMRVIMDFVPNHVSDEHRWHRHAAEHGNASPYWGHFERGDDGAIGTYFGWDNLKNLDYDEAEVQRYVIESFAHWVRAFDIDGFRVDVAWGPRRRAPEFWPRWRAELKRIKPDLFLVAEASARDPYYVANGFDTAYDWTEDLGTWAWGAAFGEAIDLAALRRALAHPYAEDTLILRFLNNNDTGERFATRHGLDTARVAATLLFTVPGVPLIYAGDEMAAAYEPYDEGPPLDWAAPAPLAAHYRRLSDLRRAEPGLRAPDLRLVATDRDDVVVAYRRGDLLVMLNFDGRPVTPHGPELGSGPWTDLLSGESVADLALPPYGARVLRLIPARPAAARSAGPAG